MFILFVEDVKKLNSFLDMEVKMVCLEVKDNYDFYVELVFV